LVAPTEVADLVREGAVLIDVRELNEWNAGRIPLAELKPMTEISDWYTDLPREGDIIFYCRTGQRSGQVVEALVEQAGFNNVYNMTGGIIAWANEGLDVDGPIDD
jgi:rhodanese-related sulfurtransferase